MSRKEIRDAGRRAVRMRAIQIIPTTSVDQHAATLAPWFRVGNAELGLIFSNLDNFASRDLGFMA